ncbi:MAG: deoxyguanosinetriphosphate triphosphohydrolase family protein, partial [Marinirhabdus sp.]
MNIYSKHDYLRFGEENKSNLDVEDYRSHFSRDYARLLHSPSFRRLTGKTQLFPNNETDFFRNRLTHSLEVSQIAKSIARRLNHNHKLNIDEDLVSFSALAHDLGHPPFGHQGEEALDECMLKYGGFEGNAQTLRIITKIEKKIVNEDYPCGIDADGKDIRKGLNLTYRAISSILKYDNVIPFTKKERKKY